MSTLTEGQIIGLWTLAGSVVVGGITAFSARFGTFQTRQTDLEKNLLAQMQTTSVRLDTLERERTALEASFRTQLEEGAAQRRKIENEYRDIMQKLEDKNDLLEERNRMLTEENYQLKRRLVGIEETVLPKPQIRKTNRDVPEPDEQ